MESTDWQIQQPSYALSYHNLSIEPTVEQISFHYTIYYIVSGSLELLSEQTSKLIHSKEFIFISPTKSYQISKASGHLLTIKIKKDILNQYSSKLALDWQGKETFFLQTVISNDPYLQNLCSQIIQEVAVKSIGYQLVLDAILSQIIIDLLRNKLRSRPNPQLEISRVGMVDRRLRRAIEYIYNNYAKDLSLSEIAEAAFLSEYHFAHLFKKLTGITPNNYLAIVRIEQAKKLLANTDQSIVTISLAVGYSSQSHFTKVFRAFTGLTPAKYRERLLG